MCNMEDDECNDLVVELKNDVGDIETSSLAGSEHIGNYDDTNFVHTRCVTFLQVLRFRSSRYLSGGDGQLGYQIHKMCPLGKSNRRLKA